MAERLKLHETLRSLMGSNNVYFQPPGKEKMSYPAIIYNRSKIESIYADDVRYGGMTRYMLTYISRDPDDDMVKKLLELPYCSHERQYRVDGLNHDVFDLYY